MSGHWIRLNDAYVRIDRLASLSLAPAREAGDCPPWLVWYEESHIIDCLLNLYCVPGIADIDILPYWDDDGVHHVAEAGRHWPMEAEHA